MDLSRYVFAWDWEQLTAPDWLFQTARAYLESSIHLFEAMLTGQLKKTFHHARAAAFLFNHSVELFLKGAICQAGRPVQVTHALADLYQEMRSLYPDKKFDFEARIGDIVAEQASTSPRSEFMRYPIDKSGNIWHGSVHFELNLWIEELRKFLADFQRLEPLFKEQYPR